MTLRDKELEDRIEEVGNRLTTPPSDTQQLLMLLDKTENLLSRVEQCPPQSMHAALHPSMKALTTKDLLRHSDLDVKIAVASCLSEITRITAPDAPYDDDLMKEIFGLIVGAFKNLDEIPSSSFSKRVSILETVAKVRSCVLMLDLECDDLILDMFFHFLKTIRPKHSETVFSSMETVMTLVIEESENISTGLLSCLLGYLKLDEKNVMPSAKKLAEKVLTNCALKLKPYLSEFFKGICAPPSEYSKIVAAVCQGNLGTIMQNETNTSGETQADNSKLSDRTLCDERPQGSGKQEQNAVLHEKSVVPENDVLPVKDVADADVSCKVATSNGAFQVGNGDSVALEQKAELSQHSDQLRDTGGSMLVASDNLGSGAEKLDSVLNISSRKGRKRKALGNLISNEHSQYDKKEAAAVTGRRKSRSKHADLSQAGSISVKEVERTDGTRTGKKKKLEQNSGLADVTASVSLHTPKEDKVNLKKGRSRHSKSFGRRNSANKSVVDGLSSATGHRGFLETSQTTSADFPTTVPSSKKSEAINESERNLFKCSSSKRQTCVEDSITTPTSATCDSETKHQRQRSRSGSKKDSREIEFSENKSGTGRKKKKGGGLLADVDDKEVKLKELVSSRKSMKKESSKEQNHLKDVYDTESTRKLGLATQETFGVSKRRKNDKLLVGKKIRVWWPEDQKFYDGVVDSFDQNTKKHTIFYDDGDVEVLLLKEEKWEIIEAETNSDGVLENTTPDNASERKKKKVKGRQDDAASDKSETDPPLKRSSSSTIKIESIDKLSKRKGRPPGKTSDEMHKESSKRRGKSTKGRTDKSYKDNDQLTETANKLNNEVPGKKSKSDPPKSAADKIDHATPKSGDKVRLKTLKIRGKVKDESGLSDDIGPKSRKKSGDSHDFRVKPKVNGSPKPHTRGIPKNSGGRPAKGSSRKARGGVTPRIGKDLNSDDTSNKIDQPKKAGEAEEGRSTAGKKRKRGRFGK